MKKILFLLLFTITSYGQAVFDEGIQITGNANSATATKVNVQEANGKVNTQTINTGFNKNIGLGGSDVVGANTLLNQYSTTPLEWTATAYNSGQVVFFVGKQWISKISTVAGDVPSASSKWEEITFEALANKTVTVDQTIIDGSTNAVSGNAVFDELALKSNIDHTHVASQITDLSKASVGLGNVDNTSDLSKPLSTATINALATKAPISSVHNPVTLGTANGLNLSNQQISLGLASSGVTGALSGTDWNTFNNKENSFTKNTAFNKNFGITAGTVVEGGTLGSNAYNSTAYLPLSGGTLTGILNIDGVDSPVIFFQQNSSLISLFTNNFGIYGTGSKTDFNTYVYGNNPYGIWTNGVKRVTVGGDGNTTFSGTISASPATTANQVPTWGQVQAIARPYKVYTALLTQTGTNAPVATVLENTTGEIPILSRINAGAYAINLTSPRNKTFVLSTPATNFIFQNIFVASGGTSVRISTASLVGSTITPTDGLLQITPIEIRIYP